MKRLLLISGLLLVSLLAGAQRTSSGERQIAVTAGTTFSHYGAEVFYGQYLLRGYWFGGLGFHNRLEIDAPSGEKVFFPRLQGRGGYMYRLLSTYSRALSLYGGGPRRPSSPSTTAGSTTTSSSTGSRRAWRSSCSCPPRSRS